MNQAESYLNHEWNSYVCVTSRLPLFCECLWLWVIVRYEGLNGKKTALKWNVLDSLLIKSTIISCLTAVRFSLFIDDLFPAKWFLILFFMWKCKKSNKESHFKSDEYFKHDPQILPKDKIFFYRAAFCKRDRFVTRKTSSFKNANTVQSFDT